MSEADDDLRLRVADLERVVAELRGEIARLSAAGARTRVPLIAAPTRRAAPTASAEPAGRAPAPAPATPIDRASRFEDLVGRYGVLALATLTTVAAVGTFVSWAAMHGLLGPTARVVLGLILAVALAAAGLRIRKREPSFGSTLLALALVVVQVCAWAAGPGLHLVPSTAAFALAAVASVALAAFARFETEEPLWCIGMAGAAVAPFVASEQSGSMFGLALYGGVVGVMAAAGIGARRWRYAQGTLAAVAVLYAVALQFAGTPLRWGPLLAVGVPIAIAVAGVLPFTVPDLVRPRLRSQGVIAAFAALAASAQVGAHDARLTGLLLAAAGVGWLAIAHLRRNTPADATHTAGAAEPVGPAWTDGMLIPVLLAAASAYAWPEAGWSRAAALAGAAVVLVVAVWPRLPGASRDALALTAGAAALAAGALAPWSWSIAHPAANAAAAVLAVAALRWRPSASWLVGLALALVASGAHTWILMDARPAFVYQPFGTRASLAALLVLAACAVAAWQAGSMARALAGAAPAGGRPLPDDVARAVRRWALAAPWVWAFLWTHGELGRAWSPSIATFAVVSLEAGVAVALVWVGRARAARGMRQAGLLLAVVAAVRALTAVDAVASVSMRIASYLVVSAFLLGIAYWYRRRGSAGHVVGDRVES